MNFILILVSSDNERPLLDTHLREVENSLPMQVLGRHWLRYGKAAELRLSDRPAEPVRRELESILAEDRIDFFILSDNHKRKKMLLIADMDNTMVIGETLDELAAQCGLKEQISTITEQTMQGKLNFQAALQERVAILRDLPESALQATLAAIQPMPGAELLVGTMRRHGARCILVSGAFSCFTEPVAAQLGFHASHGNTLEILQGRLTGKVGEPILDHHAKLSFLQHYQALYHFDVSDILAIGDGANDLSMIRAAGLGVGFHPKSFLKERIDNSILYGDLTALLYAQGYEEF